MKKRHWMFTRSLASLLAGFATVLFGFITPLAAEEATATAQVVWQHTGRAYLNGTLKKAIYVGYLIHINGIPNPLFNGEPPSEATAHFTFRTDLDLSDSISNGPITFQLVYPGTVSLYYHPIPGSDWGNPDTFSSGLGVQLIATFQRQETFFPIVGPLAFCNHTEVLLSSDEFTFNGKTYNLSSIAPWGVTFAQFFDSTPIEGAGIAGYPYVFASVGVVTAVGTRVSVVGRRAN